MSRFRVRPGRLVLAGLFFVLIWTGPGSCLRGDNSDDPDRIQDRIQEAEAEVARQQNLTATARPAAILQDARLRLAEMVPPTPPQLLGTEEPLGGDVDLFGSELVVCPNAPNPMPVAVGEEGLAFGASAPAAAQGLPMLMETSIAVTYETDGTDWEPLFECVKDHNAKPHVVLEALSVTSNEEGSTVEASYTYYSCSAECVGLLPDPDDDSS